MTTSKIGRYEVKSEIAKGGMATVFHAYDPNFERDVAIKVLPHAMLHDPQFRTRFEREAKMIALLEHPAIVPVYDFGEESGQPYIVMRYMAGGSLAGRLDQGPLSLTETVQIINRLAPALDAAHARNIIHRDLKPGNILFDQYGNAYLSDFGIARLAASSGMTITGSAILGTPSYMSPEQVQGDKDIDGRSDLYSLGVLVFHMLTGQTPYQAESPGKVMMMHILQPPPNILAINPNLPSGCDALIQKSMSKDPADRFSTSNELAQVLESLSHADSGGILVQPVGGAPAAPSRSPAQIGPSAATLVPARTVLVSQEASLAGSPVAQQPQAAQPKSAVGRRSGMIAAAIVVLCLVAAGIGGFFYMNSQGGLPLANASTATATLTEEIAPPLVETQPPTQTQAPATDTPQPSQTPAPTDIPATPTEAATATPAGAIIGGADKIAYILEDDIYVANMDGTDIQRLTEDKTTKASLTWSTDGQSVQYISGQCVLAVRLADGGIETIFCLNFIQYLKSFEVSPDGTQAAFSLDNQLYIVPYDVARLNQVKTRGELTEMATCKDWAPYTRNFVKLAHWSDDGKTLAMVIFGVASGIGSADIIQMISLEECTPTPKIIDNFPPPRFRPPDYVTSPTILQLWLG